MQQALATIGSHRILGGGEVKQLLAVFGYDCVVGIGKKVFECLDQRFRRHERGSVTHSTHGRQALSESCGIMKSGVSPTNYCPHLKLLGMEKIPHKKFFFEHYGLAE